MPAPDGPQFKFVHRSGVSIPYEDGFEEGAVEKTLPELRDTNEGRMGPEDFGHSITVISALHPKRPVGHLFLDEDDNSVSYIWTHPEHRRQGVATGLLNYAQRIGRAPTEDWRDSRSESGQALAEGLQRKDK